MMKRARYMLEYAALRLIYGVFQILPVDAASALGGWLGRTIGPLTGTSRRAFARMETALPWLSAAQHTAALVQMWDNLGRIFGEYPHLAYIAQNRVTIKTPDIISDAVKNNAGGIFCGAHIGNWEINTLAFRVRYDTPIAITYRALNNPYADALLLKARTLNGAIPAFRKARESGRDMLKTLKGQGFLGIMFDQKYNEGIAVQFFGREAMTNPVAVEMAQKLKCPLLFAHCRRLGGAHFELSVSGPANLYESDGSARSAATVLAELNAILENLIRAEPGQWLWVHNRWPDSGVK